MKKVFVQLWKRVLKYRKKIIYGALALFVVQACFFDIWWIWMQNQVFAETKETASQSDSFNNIVTKKTELLSFIKTAIYVLLYPLLFLAGKLVDNSFVYWEIFWFDAVLWKLWNFVRNLANFWLGFIFVYKIFKYLIDGQKAWDMKKILVSSLIAWIWIQASWFLMAVLIDVSTILIYWVWWLPISVLWNEINTSDTWNSSQNDSGFNPYVFKTLISVDADNISDINIYMTNISTGNLIYISECRTFSYKKSEIEESLILAPKMIYYQDSENNFHATMDNACHLYGQIYWFKDLIPDLNPDGIRDIKNSASNVQEWKNAQGAYSASGTNYIGQANGASGGNIAWEVEWCKILEIWNAHEKGGVLYSKNFNITITWEKCWIDVDNEWIWSGTTAKFKDLMHSNNVNSYVWVFTSLYSSLLNAGSSIILSNNTSAYESFLSILLTLGHMIAIAIPLIAVVLVFVMRIWIIRIAIALSPMIALLEAFGLFDSDSLKNNKFLGYFKLKNLIWIIFAPAIICFAISMSTVLVKVIERINISKVYTEPLILWWLVQIDLAWFTIWIWQLIIAVMWIAITRFLVRTAVKSSKFWEQGGIIDNLYNLANSTIWSMPIVPIPWERWKWVEFIWANTAFGLNDQDGIMKTSISKIRDKYNAESTETLNQRLNNEPPKKPTQNNADDNNKYQGYSSWLLSLPVNEIWGGWISKEIKVWDEVITFASLNEWDQKKVIDQINNISDTSRKDAFGKWSSSLQVWWDTYTYDMNTHGYRIETPSQT